MNLPKRKPNRLKEYDYSTPGAYFVTVCTKDRKQMLSKISITDTVGDGAYTVPQNKLTNYGFVCDEYINNINNVYKNISVDKYVIMPNHIHMLISVDGTMKASSPTIGIENIIRSFKTMVTKQIGCSIWQRSYHDHIVRNEHDYKKIWEYIDTNVIKWENDCFFDEK